MGNYTIYKIGQFIVAHFPLVITYCIAGILSSLQYVVSIKDRRSVRNNLKVIIPEVNSFKREFITWRVFANFGHYLVDFLRLSTQTKEEIVKKAKITNRHILDKALKAGKGVILTTAHIGNWELGGVITSLSGYKLLAIALSHDQTEVNDFFNNLRAVGNVRVAQIKRAAFECMRTLKNNECIALVADRDFTNAGLVTDFFNMPTLIPKGPATLALKTGAAIVPVFSYMKKNNKVELVVEEPLSFQPTDDFEGDVKRITESIVRILEKRIKQNPEQWFMFRQFWIDNENLRNHTHA
ncbi:MAG: lysophospholipid acyltransferase family protein [Candidatus Gygaella obscura]|nr:lysophospholipid acyltransferase family protein [Candidatus Gygaella obscura]